MITFNYPTFTALAFTDSFTGTPLVTRLMVL